MSDEEKEQAAIEEGKLPLPQKTQYIGVSPEAYSNLVNYLQSKPFKEVAGILQGLATTEKKIEINGN